MQPSARPTRQRFILAPGSVLTEDFENDLPPADARGPVRLAVRRAARADRTGSGDRAGVPSGGTVSTPSARHPSVLEHRHTYLESPAIDCRTRAACDSTSVFDSPSSFRNGGPVDLLARFCSLLQPFGKALPAAPERCAGRAEHRLSAIADANPRRIRFTCTPTPRSFGGWNIDASRSPCCARRW